MRRLMAAVTFGCCLVVAGQSEGLAQGPDYIKLKALLPPAPDAQACYARTYDPEHLQQHPKQKVTELVLFLRYITLSEEDATLISTENGGTEKQYSATTSPWRRRPRSMIGRSMRAAIARRRKGSAAGWSATAAASRSSP